jgi:UDP-N-acetyl-D-glucosamine dehydrogenase
MITMAASRPLTSVADELRRKIENRSARAAVVGLGYVGLPLLVEFGRAGYWATGIDQSVEKISCLAGGKSYIPAVDQDLLATLTQTGRIKATTKAAALTLSDTVSICVPTPLRKTKDPDMSFILAVTEQVAAHLHPGMLIILESTTYPGTTEELILPMLESSGMKVGEDFFLCFSPERVDPGNPKYHTRNIPKVIGGVTPKCTEIGGLFYSRVMERVVPVSSTRVAEMVKLLENTFRMINIGLANEMAMMCDRMGIDVWEVIDAAATKPFGFMPYYPGPGLGGHCIPVDPLYLSWKTRQSGQEAQFIELAARINGTMPKFVVDKIQNMLNDRSKPVRGSRIHVIGVAYKKDVSDTRESPALDIISLLEAQGAEVTYSDPYVARLEIESRVLESQPLETAAQADCVLIVTDHSGIDYERLVEMSPLILDTRNCLKDIDGPRVLRLYSGKSNCLPIVLDPDEMAEYAASGAVTTENGHGMPHESASAPTLASAWGPDPSCRSRGDVVTAGKSSRVNRKHKAK